MALGGSTLSLRSKAKYTTYLQVNCVEDEEKMDCEARLASLEADYKNLKEEFKMWKSKFVNNDVQKLPTPEFKTEWYAMTHEWVTENYEKDTLERNRELVEFTNDLEQTFVAKLKSLFRGTKYENDMSPEYFAKLLREGAVDSNQMDQMHAFGLKLQKIYVEKMIQLYDLQPSFFGFTQSEFCEVFEKC